MTTNERRRAVRAPAKLAMEIKLGGDHAAAETINVSANGVYFITSTHIAPLTRLQVTLMLPDGGDEGSAKEVICDGVVVRVQPEIARDDVKEYEVACYFTAITDRDRADLETYILSQLAF